MGAMATVPIEAGSSPSVVLELLYRLKVKDAMTAEVVSASPASRIRDIQILMKEKTITGVPIQDGQRLAGIVSIGDVIEALDGGSMERPAVEIMSGSPITLDADMPLSFAVTYFDRYKFGRFPVLDGSGRLCGIITASDVLRRLLIALNEEINRMEERLARGEGARHEGAAEAHPPVVELSFGTAPLDFSRAGNASRSFKKALTDKGCPPPVARKAAVASYELELNQVIHSSGGVMRMRVYGDSIEIVARDEGPGIADVDLALTEGYSTANEWVRTLGFGAGMGLPNVRRVADEFSITSAPGSGTMVRAVVRWERHAVASENEQGGL